MEVLWLNLAAVFLFSLLARYFATPVLADISVPIKPNKIMVFAALLSLVLVSGLRENLGDTFFYKHSYENNEFTWEYIFAEKDIGFGILQMILKSITEDSQLLILLTAALTNILIIVVLYKYSRLFEIALYVYITGGLYLVFMNGIRQALAAALIFAATKYLIKGNWLKYFLVVLLASLFHQSALILIPFYFLVRYKAWSKATFILLVFSVFIALGYEQFSALLFSAIENTQYGHYSEFHEGGANIIRVAVEGLPLFIAYLGRDKLRELFPSSDYIVNMALIGFVFMVISTQNWIFARFSFYFAPYQLILVSWIVKLFTEKNQRFVYFAIIVCYFVYYYYENVVSLNIEYISEYIDVFFIPQ